MIFLCLFYSTVTDLAKFFGLSILQPFNLASSYAIIWSGITARSGSNISFTFGITTFSSYTSLSSIFWFVMQITLAPLDFTSFILLIVLGAIFSSVIIATTGVLSSINDIVPCFNSPAA